MERDAIKPDDVVLVDWIDSYTLDGWMQRDAPPQVADEGGTCHTVAFVHSTDDTWLTLISTTSGGGNILGYLRIPWCAVKWFEVLKGGE